MTKPQTKPQTKSEIIRILFATGASRKELCDEYGNSLVSHALKHIPKGPQGRPRKLTRCEQCGQPLPKVNARA